MVFEGYHSLFPHFPILLKLKYPVFVLILICFSTDWLQYPVPANKVTLAPSTVSLFSLGLFLSSIKLAEVKHVYKKFLYSPRPARRRNRVSAQHHQLLERLPE